MRAQENKCQISQNDTLHMKNFRTLSVFSQIILMKFDIYFLGLPWEIVFGVITDN